jgi:protein O-mannosyl-transferase
MITRLDKRFVGICLGLALVTGCVYWPVTRYGFVSLDDPYHILYNHPVNSGLTWQGLRWAMQSGYAYNWQPLTWISHMIDCSLYGLKPGGHHLTNLLLHVANSLLLFTLMCKMTGARWRSALVAALFAWHPVHVESVAWISERKDVLSGFFFLLALSAYVRYVEERTASCKLQVEGCRLTEEKNLQPSTFTSSHGVNLQPWLYYALALALFALGLMSKAMLVTTPFVLLLLDFWPLQRVSSPWSLVSSSKSGATRPNSDLLTTDYGLRTKPHHSITPSLRLLLEKLPFFVLSLASSLVTFLVQKDGGAVVSLAALPFSTRMANAAVSYLRYLEKTLWPANLAICYTYTNHLPVALVTTAALLIPAGCVFAWMLARRQPYLLVGWFWFLGMLVPVIGLVQVGAQAMADRYLYLPSIGLFVMLVWGTNDLLSQAMARRGARDSSNPGWAAAAVALVVLAACLVCSSRQLGYWRNGETLFRHALAVTTDNAPAHDGLATALKDSGRTSEALAEYRESVRLQPDSPDAQRNLAGSLLDAGQPEEALCHFEAALQLWPSNAKTHVGFACCLFRLGRFDEARLHFAEAARLDPSNAQIHYNLGTVLLTLAKVEDAAVELDTAVRLDPNYASEAVKLAPGDALLRYNLGTILLMQSRVEDGIAQLAEAVRLNPDLCEAHRNLAVALLRQGNAAAGIQHLSEAARLKPDDAEVHSDLGQALLDQHHAEEAAAQFHECLRLKPEDPRMHFRLAAAYAETGRFTEAVQAAQKAHDLAVAGGLPDLANQAGVALKRYQSGQAH